MNTKNFLLILAFSFSINILSDTYTGRICISQYSNPITRLSSQCCTKLPRYITNIDRDEDIAIMVVIELDKPLSINTYYKTKEFLFLLPLKLFVTTIEDPSVFKKTGDKIELMINNGNVLELILDNSFDKFTEWSEKFMETEKSRSNKFHTKCTIL